MVGFSYNHAWTVTSRNGRGTPSTYSELSLDARLASLVFEFES